MKMTLWLLLLLCLIGDVIGIRSYTATSTVTYEIILSLLFIIYFAQQMQVQ